MSETIDVLVGEVSVFLATVFTTSLTARAMAHRTANDRAEWSTGPWPIAPPSDHDMPVVTAALRRVVGQSGFMGDGTLDMAAAPTVVVALVALAVLARVNMRDYRLPDRLNAWGTAATLVTAAISAVVAGDSGLLLGPVVGAIALFVLFFLARVCFLDVVGYGTVKSTPILGAGGAVLGAAAWVTVAVVPCVLVTAYGGYLMLFRHERREVPTGPAFLAALGVAVGGAMLGVL